MKNIEYDLVCVGGGIMSATLALLCKTLKPDLNILILERLKDVAKESTASWNNAGTGHSALCELNYTPEEKDGTIDIHKAIEICKQFEISKQFWAYLVNENLIEDPSTFITKCPHHSFVTGKKNVLYLENRFKAMKEHFMFDSIQFTKEFEIMKQWFPLILQGRDKKDVIAASRIDRGTEMNFGSLTKQLYTILENTYNTKVSCNKEVVDVDPSSDENWSLKVRDVITNEDTFVAAKHVFIGAGGGSLTLLEKVEIDEKDGYGGFPISGEWLVCKNEKIINQHFAKVYSMAEIGSPPMSVPHLDTRYINGKRELLFGPFAGFTTKFLKKGSNLDLFKSIKIENLHSMWGVFWHNLSLTKYLIHQVMMSFDDRMNSLRVFMKNAKNEDWKIIVAGQRVQTIKRDEKEGGTLEFGTEIVSSKCGKITCLLGASPGASTSVVAMLEVIEKAFPEILNSDSGKEILKSVIPSLNVSIDSESFKKNLEDVTLSLGLK